MEEFRRKNQHAITFVQYYYIYEEEYSVETFYLVDFENVHNKGIENIFKNVYIKGDKFDSVYKNDHVHVFSTKNDLNIDSIAFWLDNVHPHLVAEGKESVDKHLESYLGFLLCKHGTNNEYIIVSKDTDYDNIITFWKEKGYTRIERKPEIPKKEETKTATKIPKKEETERERKVRSSFNDLSDVEFIRKNKEEIIDIIVKAQTKQEAETELKKLHKQNPCNIDNWIVTHILRIMKL